MKLNNGPIPTTRLIPAVGLLAASLTLAACGSASPLLTSNSASARPVHSAGLVHHYRVLDTAKLQRAIEQGALAQRGLHAVVTCPSGVHQEKGRVFSCTALVGHVSTRFVVTELDGLGNVHYAAP
jgi:hypothetical protein